MLTFLAFDEINKIKDDNEKLLNIVLRKQSNTVTEENKKLLEKILLYQKMSEEGIYI